MTGEFFIISVPTVVVAYPKIDWLYLPYLFSPTISEALVWLLWVLSGLVTLPVMFYSGRHFYSGAWAALPGSRSSYRR